MEPLSVADARTHPLLKSNLAVSELGVIAYLGMPLTTTTGHTLGSFCVIDTVPREWQAQDVEILRDLADLVMEKIELRLLAKQLHTDYFHLRSLELYREEMVQMLVYDLRNPLSSRGLQVYLKDIDYPLKISWFWLKRADNKRELRFVASTYPYSGVYLVRLGRKRWAIEGFFKTVKHQFDGEGLMNCETWPSYLILNPKENFQACSVSQISP